MLWTCPKCKTENPKASSFCQSCGEKKEEMNSVNKVQSNRQPLDAAKKTSQYVRDAESLFNKRLTPRSFHYLETYALITMGISGLLYLIGVISFIAGMWMELGFWTSLITAATVLLTAFFFQVASEMIHLFIYGQECWFMSAKQSYINTQLNDELIRQVESLEKKVEALSKTPQKE